MSNVKKKKEEIIFFELKKLKQSLAGSETNNGVICTEFIKINPSPNAIKLQFV